MRSSEPSLGCRPCETEACGLLASEGFSEPEIESALATLDSKRLEPFESKLLSWVRGTVHYQPAITQNQTRALAAEIGEAATSDKDYEARLKGIVDAADLPATRKQQLLGMKKEELLREIVDNVGKRGAAGQDLQNVISVAMLSEGWDAKTVTHIMGLRAFTSQLL